MKRKRKTLIAIALVTGILSNLFAASGADADDGALYGAYRRGFDAIHMEEEIGEKGFRVIESQSFEMEHGQLGIIKLIPAIHEQYSRVALFFAQQDGAIVLKTDNFMANSWLKGQLRQTNREVICISCVNDLDGDGLADIIVITSCQNGIGTDADTYNVGDVLFQNETGFYRDPRLSDKINRFDMNKSAEYIQAFVVDGVSMEFLFVAKDFEELLAGGFKPINYLRVSEHLEKFGVVEVIPGYYSMTGQNYLMIYIVDGDGNILWNFQPMHHYQNFYDILALSLNKDIDGDGNKDLMLLARYVDLDEQGNSYLKTDYDIYYQRAGYFLEDTQFKYSYACGEDDDIDTITNKSRQYWGWPQ